MKALVLRVPGSKRLVAAMRALARNLVPRMPALRHWAWRQLFVEQMVGDECVISAVQACGHEIDHHMSRGVRVPAQSVLRMEVLLKDIADRGIPLGPSVAWAVQLYGIARMGLHNNYLKFSAFPSDTDPSVAAKDKAASLDQQEARTAISECIATRRSVRRWTGRDVDLDKVREIIREAMWAPSSCNRQAWKVLLLTDSDDKQFLTRYYRSAHNHFWTSAPLLVVVMANLEAYIYPRTQYVQLDSGAFIQNLLLLFHAHGLGACWVGFTSWDNYGNCDVEESRRDQFYSRFGLPVHYLPMSLVPVGYPAVFPRPPSRKTVDEIIL